MKDIFVAHEAYCVEEGRELYHDGVITPVNRQKWRTYYADMKVELHVHLDGNFDPSLFSFELESAQKDYDCLSEKTFCPWDQTYLPVR